MARPRTEATRQGVPRDIVVTRADGIVLASRPCKVVSPVCLPAGVLTSEFDRGPSAQIVLCLGILAETTAPSPATGEAIGADFLDQAVTVAGAPVEAAASGESVAVLTVRAARAR
jgi:hypothetical protein